MKNILSILVGLLVVIGCSDGNRQKPDASKLEMFNGSNYYDQRYHVYTLEGCEYIVAGAGKTQWGSHKGNCKNPIHYTK